MVQENLFLSDMQHEIMRMAEGKFDLWFTESTAEEAVTTSSQLFQNAKREIIWLLRQADIGYGAYPLWQHTEITEVLISFLEGPGAELHVIVNNLEVNYNRTDFERNLQHINKKSRGQVMVYGVQKSDWEGYERFVSVNELIISDSIGYRYCNVPGSCLGSVNFGAREESVTRRRIIKEMLMAGAKHIKC